MEQTTSVTPARCENFLLRRQILKKHHDVKRKRSHEYWAALDAVSNPNEYNLHLRVPKQLTE